MIFSPPISYDTPDAVTVLAKRMQGLAVMFVFEKSCWRRIALKTARIG